MTSLETITYIELQHPHSRLRVIEEMRASGEIDTSEYNAILAHTYNVAL